MSKLEEFKNFVLDKPWIIEKVRSNVYTWQTLYEAYDIYGAGHEYFQKEVNLNNDKLKSAINVIKDIDLDKVSVGLENVKKVVGAIKEISKSDIKETFNLPSYMKKGTFRRYND